MKINMKTKSKRKTIIFVTGNYYKFKAAKIALKNTGINLVQKNMDVPEIQNESVEKIAAFSAKWAANILRKPVIASDGGYYIEALNGFPGPFIKYINKWLSPKDLLKIMSGKKNRRAAWLGCIAYCEPNKKPIVDIEKFNGKLALKSGKNIYRKDYGWIDTLFIPDGHKKPLSELSIEDYIKFWGNDIGWIKIIKKFSTGTNLKAKLNAK